MRPLLMVVTFALAAAAPAAAMMLRVPLDEAARDAGAIVEAKVVSRSSALDPVSRLIHTDVELEVLDGWKGSLAPGARVTVRVLGGEVDGVRMQREHEPVFAAAERTVLYLARGESRWSVQHLEQGKFRVDDGHVIDFAGVRTPIAEFRAAVARSLVSPKR